MRRTQLRFFYGVVFLNLIYCLPTTAQVATGTPPFGSFGGGPDIVNLENLNVHIPIPILIKAGRMIPFIYTYGYDSSVWYPQGSSGSQSWGPVVGWGWKNLTQPAIGYLTYTKTIHECRTASGGEEPGVTDYSNWEYIGPDGTAHAFVGTSDTNECSGGHTQFTSTTTDGSGYTLTAVGSTGAVTSPDGAVATGAFTGLLGTANFKDRNGNEISGTAAGVFTDTTGLTALTVTYATPPSPTTITYTAPNEQPASFTIIYGTYTVRTNFGCSGITEFGPTTEYLVSSIELPDSTSYHFSYESTPGYSGDVTGRLASVSLPTGGSIAYAYTGSNNGIGCTTGGAIGLTRTVSPGGQWTYSSVVGTGSTSTTTVTDPMGNQTVVNFFGMYETERQTYQGTTSGTLLETTFTCYNGGTPNCNSYGFTPPITELSVYVQWPGTNGLESLTNTFYNSYGLTTETDEYAYGAGAPGSIVRKTLITYASLGNGIVDKPATVTVEDGSGNVHSQTTYFYDQTAVTPTTGTPQQVAVSGSRGNATTVSYLVQGSTSLSKTYTYYDTGNVYQATDVNSAQTSYTYGACGNSYATGVSEPLGFSRSIAWNCVGGVITSATDENAQTFSYSFTDPFFWRPNSLTDPLLNVTNYSYANAFSTESALTFSGGTSTSTSDTLGTIDPFRRVTISQIKESPTSSTYDSVETDYDSVGRPSRTTLPYAAAAGVANPSAPSTNVTYDALSRKLQVTNSGNLTVTYSYSQNDTYQTVGPAPTGENTKRKQTESDALGRLTSVCEITSATGSGTCAQTSAVTGYWTEYAYNVLNDLTVVTQNAQSSGSQQTRSYTYDDLGRKTSESNPENGLTQYFYDTDPGTVGTTCPGTYAGDLIKKYDAVGNTTCYTYDARHRVTSTSYSGPYASSTPNKYFVYDAATVNSVVMAYAKTRIAEAYTCVSPCTTKITDLGFSYTVLGQATDVYEYTPHSGSYYHVTGTYYPNGALKQLSNLVGLPTITYDLEGEGRVNSASASSGQNPLTSTVYNSASLPTQVNLGSSDSDSYTYNSTTDRMATYTYSVNGESVVGSLTWYPIGTLETLTVTDAFYSGGNQTCNYTHDDMSRIASANCGSPWSQTFSYDAFGNISKSGTISFQPTYSYLTNRMTQIGSSTPTYDLNGNVLADTAHTYAWDANGRPVTIDGVSLTYDALGRMVEQDKSGVYREIAYAPEVGKLAIMSGQTLFEAFVPLSGGSVAVYNSAGLAYYRHSDWLGSSRFASTPARALYSDGSYAPFGENYAQTGTTDLSFTGMNQDTVTNLFDFPAREYNGIHGRWPSPDPAGLSAASLSDPQSLNRYAYARNSPVEFTDPTGLCTGSGCRELSPNALSSAISDPLNLINFTVQSTSYDLLYQILPYWQFTFAYDPDTDSYSDLATTYYPGQDIYTAVSVSNNSSVLYGGGSGSLSFAAFPFAAAARGRFFEQAVLEMLGVAKNTVNIGGAIPDAYAPGQVMVEIKDVQYLYKTTQVGAEIAGAEAEGIPLYVVVSPTTEVAGTVATAVAETGGEVAIADVAAGTVVGAATGETLLELLPFLFLL